MIIAAPFLWAPFRHFPLYTLLVPKTIPNSDRLLLSLFIPIQTHPISWASESIEVLTAVVKSFFINRSSPLPFHYYLSFQNTKYIIIYGSQFYTTLQSHLRNGYQIIPIIFHLYCQIIYAGRNTACIQVKTFNLMISFCIYDFICCATTQFHFGISVVLPHPTIRYLWHTKGCLCWNLETQDTAQNNKLLEN